LHEAVASALKGVVDDWEVVYVNDGSTDSSLELLKGLQAVDSHVVVVELSRNWGHMGAISAGLQTARGRAIILSTHILEIAQALCHRVAIVHRGRVAAVGSLAELRAGAGAGSDRASLEDLFLQLTENPPGVTG